LRRSRSKASSFEWSLLAAQNGGSTSLNGYKRQLIPTDPIGTQNHGL
jgi:hypothetical protein